MLHSGLMTPTTGSNAFLIRKGRQKVANAKWKNTAYTGRLTWMPAPGVNFGVSLQHQDDLTQSQGTAGTATSATLFEGHADIRRQISSNIEIGVRALLQAAVRKRTAREARGERGLGARAVLQDVPEPPRPAEMEVIIIRLLDDALLPLRQSVRP